MKIYKETFLETKKILYAYVLTIKHFQAFDITCKCKIMVGIGRMLSQGEGVKVNNLLKIYITVVSN